MAGNSRRIEIDVIAHDSASRIFTHVGNSMNSMSARVNNGITALNQGLSRYNNAMAGMQRVTQMAMLGAGYLVYRFTKDSVKAFAEFEKQHGKTMGAIVNNYDKTAVSQAKFLADQKKLKEQSLQLGTTGPTGKGSFYNPTEVSFAQTALSKAGVKADKIGPEMPTVLKFAGGNDLGIETATEYAVNIAEMFNIPHEKWKDMLDKVTRTADISTIDVPDIFETLKYAGPTAAALGRSLDETLSMIAVMGNAGLKGSIAGTGINAFYTRLLSPIGKSETAMNTAPSEYSENALRSFIAESVTPEGKFKSTADVTQMLDDVMGKLNDREQAWFAQKLFGMFQMKAGYVLAANGGDNLRSVTNDIMGNAPGSTDRKWDIMLGTSWGKQQAVSNAWQGIKTDVGYRLTPITEMIYDELFRALTDKDNYDFNFNSLRTGIYKSSKMLGDQYGKKIEDSFLNYGNFGVDAVQVMGANSPIIGGFTQSFGKLLSGDFVGAFTTITGSVDEANQRIKDLPPELRTMAREVRNVVTALGLMTGINFAARLLESISTVWRYTVGAMINTATMRVTSGTVMLTSTGLLGPNGQPIYRQTTGTPTGGGTATPAGGGRTGTGGTPMIVGANGRQVQPTQPTGGQLVDSHGNVMSSGSATPAPSGPGALSRVASGLNIATWIYAIGEMTGLNDRGLDLMGVQGESRENVNTGRTVMNTALIANMVDTFLLKNAVKGMIAKVGTSMMTGAKAAIPGALSSVGIEATAVGGLVAAPLIGLFITGMLNELSNKWAVGNMGKGEQDVPGDRYMVAGSKEHPWYDPNGIFDSTPKVANIDRSIRHGQDHPEAVIQQAQESLMERLLHIFDDPDGPMHGASYVQSDESKALMSPTTMIDILGRTIGNQPPPRVNVAAPNVNVDVKVDKDGSVKVNKYITDQGPTLDNLYRLNQSRTGGGVPTPLSGMSGWR